MDIVHQANCRATPEKIYQVLTDPAQIASWYAEDTQAKPDSVFEFHFKQGVIRVQVVELEPNQRVVWKVLEGLSGWEGVTGDITWTLTTPFESGTLVHYRHRGWPTIEGPFPSTNFMSGWYLARMRSYAETGVALSRD